jgi:hypothetical protein
MRTESRRVLQQELAHAAALSSKADLAVAQELRKNIAAPITIGLHTGAGRQHQFGRHFRHMRLFSSAFSGYEVSHFSREQRCSRLILFCYRPSKAKKM